MQVLSDGLMVARLDEKAVLFMLHLKGDTTSPGGNDGNTLVETAEVSPA